MSRPRRAIRSKPHKVQNVLPQSTPLLIPGVLILSISREPLYMTLSAHKFLAELDGLTDAPWDSTVLPLAIHHVCTQLQHEGKQDLTGTDWDTLQVRQLARTPHGTILVRGYGIFEYHGAPTGRFLILLERVSEEPSVHSAQGATDCQFTARQRSTANGLVLGLTNKEIAESMLISVHTVKEYVRQLMMKLDTPSRTGIVARMAGLTLPSPKSSSHRKSQAAQATVQVT